MDEISIYLPGILLAYSAFLLAVASPGPNILAVIGTSMSGGRGSGIALALGIAAGSFTWSVLTVIGLSAVLSSYASALIFIKLCGGAYLLWLAYKSFRSAASDRDIEAGKLAAGRRSPLGFAVRGYVVMMTNPKAVIAWIAIISLGLKPDAPLWVGAAIVVGTFALSVVMHILYAVAFSTPLMVRAYGRARRYIQATLGVFFTGAGIHLLSSKQ